MAIDGSRSDFPTSLDDWGEELDNNSCQFVDAGFFNTMEDAVFSLEKHTLRVMQTDLNGILGMTISGSTRPKVLYKVYTFVGTGAKSVTKTTTLSGFTTAEKNLFNGTPLASGNSVHLQIRRADGQPDIRNKSFHVGITNPITDISGDSGIPITASTIRHGNGDDEIGAGTYIISLMVTG
jgi:hypothetical protein